MESLIKAFRQNGFLHHSYVVEGDRAIVFEDLLSFFENEVGFKSRGNPDFWHGDFDTLGIDESRELILAQQKKTLGKHKMFVIKTNFITREAQNALLKVFEEPTSGTHFFIIMPSSGGLLPTLKSRTLTFRHTKSAIPSLGLAEAESFLKLSLAEKLAFSKKFAEDISEDIKSKSDVIELLNGLEFLLKEKMKIKISEKNISLFQAILQGKSYLSGRSSSVKMILDHISMLLPAF